MSIFVIEYAPPDGSPERDRMRGREFMKIKGIDGQALHHRQVHGGGSGMNKEKGLSFQEFSEINRRRCEAIFHPLREWSPTDWATALGGETGEALNVVKKIRRIGSSPQIGHPDMPSLIAQLADELADIVTYADLLAQVFDIDLGHAVAAKFNKVSGRHGCGIVLDIPDE